MDGNRIFGCFSLLMIVGTIFWVLNDCSDYWERTDDVESTTTLVSDSVALDGTNKYSDTIESVAVKPAFQDSALSPNVVRPSSNESPSASYTPRVGCPTDEYEKGYDDGYEDGYDDGEMGLSHSSSYDVSGCFDSDDEVEYERGYEQGYDDGFYDGHHGNSNRYERDADDDRDDDDEDW